MKTQAFRLLLSLTTFVILSGLVFSACGGYDDEEGSSDGDVSDGDDSDGDTPDGDSGDYPAGPYGYVLGDTMANFSLQDADGNAVELKDYFGSATAILINHSAGWCTVCRRETPTLAEWYTDLESDGLVVLQAVFENNAGKPADQAFAESWKTEYDLPFPVLVDGNNHFLDYHPAIQAGGGQYATPLNIVLDADMRIQYLLEGDIPASIKDRLIAIIDESN